MKLIMYKLNYLCNKIVLDLLFLCMCVSDIVCVYHITYYGCDSFIIHIYIYITHTQHDLNKPSSFKRVFGTAQKRKTITNADQSKDEQMLNIVNET